MAEGHGVEEITAGIHIAAGLLLKEANLLHGSILVQARGGDPAKIVISREWQKGRSKIVGEEVKTR